MTTISKLYQNDRVIKGIFLGLLFAGLGAANHWLYAAVIPVSVVIYFAMAELS
jgi:hypothetical protein